MFNQWEDTRHKTSYIVAKNFLILLLSFFLVIISFLNKDFYFLWVRKCIYKLLFKINLSMNGRAKGLVVLCVMILIDFCLLNFITKIFVILSKNILLNKKWSGLISHNRIYLFFRERRLGYLFSLPFLFDIILCLLFTFLYFVCLKFIIKNNIYGTTLFIDIFFLFILYIALPFLITSIFCNSFHPLKHHFINYIKSQKTGLVIHNTKMPISTMNTPLNKNRMDKCFLLDQYEYLHLVSINKISHQDLSFVIIYCSSTIEDDKLISLIKQIYEIPHIGIMLDVSDCCDQNNATKTHLKYSDCMATHIDNKKVTYFDGLIGIIKNSVGYPTRNINVLASIKNSSLYDYYYNLYKSSNLIYSRFREIINVYGLRQAINGLFDLMEYILRISVFIEADTKGASFDNLSKWIRGFHYISICLSGSMIFDSVSLIETKKYFYDYEKILYSKINIELPNFMTLPEIIDYVGMLRNATKGHGFIKDEELTPIYSLLFIIALILFEKIDICSLIIKKQDNEIFLSYKGKIIDGLKKYIFFDSNDELFLFCRKKTVTRNGKEKSVFLYNSFLTGEIIKIANPQSPI